VPESVNSGAIDQNPSNRRKAAVLLHIGVVRLKIYLKRKNSRDLCFIAQ
jgi:hypothetical protein